MRLDDVVLDDVVGSMMYVDMVGMMMMCYFFFFVMFVFVVCVLGFVWVVEMWIM